jgi:hypothetical protein
VLDETDTMEAMAPEDVDQYLTELAAWCRAKHGRQREFARYIGRSDAIVSYWLDKKKIPTWKDGLKIQEFLKAQRRKK